MGAETTGNGLLIERMIGLLVQGYERTVLLSTLAITLLVLIGFRNGAAALLTLSVAGMGILATRASMLVCGITLNPANLVAVPLILGLGVDNAVHLIHAWLEGEPIEEVLSQTGRPLAMNAATSVVGFGGLMLARHNGLYSLGWSLAVGITWCWAATMLLVPGTVLILERLRRSGISTLEAPVSYRVYASGG
ncbi:MAG: hypothetical protein HUU02_15945 [Bacteroidetes bacterium]|nr:hypothetical protein [Bacteroidota bacterium]